MQTGRELGLMFFQYGDLETNYLASKDKRLGQAIRQIGHINREVDSNLLKPVTPQRSQ